MYEKVINYLNQHDFITTKQAKELGVERYILSNLAKKGVLERFSWGVYQLHKELPDELAMLQSKSNKLIYSFHTALYFHRLSDQLPSTIHITTAQGNNVTSLSRRYKNLCFHYSNPKYFDLGIIKMKSNFGNSIFVYDQERTICDLIKYKNNLDIQIFTDAIKIYFRKSDKNLRKLLNYSTQLNVETEVRKYIEVLV